MNKSAISNTLKNKATVERAARLKRIDNDYVPDRASFSFSIGERPDTNSLRESGKHHFNVKGKDPKGFDQRSTKLTDKIDNRYKQIASNSMDHKTELHNAADSLSSHINKVKTRKSVGKAALIGAGIAGAAYGGKKLYDKYKKTAEMENKLTNVVEKIGFSKNMVDALELGGLGILAKPGIDTLRNPNATEDEKSHAKWESAGLGVLGLDPAYQLGKAGLQKANPYINKATQGMSNMYQGASQNLLDSTSPLARRVGQGMQNVGPAMQKLRGRMGNIANKIKFK